MEVDADMIEEKLEEEAEEEEKAEDKEEEDEDEEDSWPRRKTLVHPHLAGGEKEICSECVHKVHLLKKSWQEAEKK